MRNCLQTIYNENDSLRYYNIICSQGQAGKRCQCSMQRFDSVLTVSNDSHLYLESVNIIKMQHLHKYITKRCLCFCYINKCKAFLNEQNNKNGQHQPTFLMVFNYNIEAKRMHEHSYNQIWIVQVWFRMATTVLKILGSASSNTDVDNMCVMSFLNKCKSQSHHVSHIQQYETRKSLYIRTNHVDDWMIVTKV